ncbi:TPA: hypothetical protein ACH3X1_004543 [Trebouxia sp. C0004]
MACSHYRSQASRAVTQTNTRAMASRDTACGMQCDMFLAVEQATPLAGIQMELGLPTRSSQVVLPSVEAVLVGVKAMVRQPQEQKHFIANSTVRPLASLKMVAISLPSPPRIPDTFHTAIHLALDREFCSYMCSKHN